MIKLISRFFKKNNDERSIICTSCSIWGIVLNIFLFAVKFTSGSISGALSVTADGLNNLSDSGSSVITLLGIKMSEKKPDPKHPFGHGRIEYMSGIAVSILIVVMGVELLKSGIGSIIKPEAPDINIAVIVSLSLSIIVKLYMFAYNKKYGKKYNATALLATSTDSVSDCISTTVVLICMIITKLTNINIDGYCSVLVAVLIIRAGIKSAFETIQPLLGVPPEKDFVKEITEIVTSGKHIMGVHDLIVHDYGPGRKMISVHAEVPANGNILQLHDSIDNIEKELFDKLGTYAVIHMDPIETDNKTTNFLKQKLSVILKEIDPAINYHDFRTVQGETHTNILFDIVVPFKYKISDHELTEKIESAFKELNGNYFCIINIDHDFNNIL